MTRFYIPVAVISALAMSLDYYTGESHGGRPFLDACWMAVVSVPFDLGLEFARELVGWAPVVVPGIILWSGVLLVIVVLNNRLGWVLCLLRGTETPIAPEEAYRKAMAAGKLSHGNEGWTPDGRKGAWPFDGISSHLPVYEELEDGAELLWTRLENKAVKTIKAQIKRKSELEVFMKDD